MTRLCDLGEKRLIADIVAPLFNPEDDPAGVGDDCATIAVPPGHDLVTSTDRVPADLTAFRVGILDYRGLGDYLARLNVSDIAACGGRPVGFLFNAGVPESISVRDFEALCEGLASAAARTGCRVLGGDISLSGEISLSGTVLGTVPRGRALTRRGADVGDVVITTRAAGLTPAAFATVAAERAALELSEIERALLRRQFTNMDPLVDLGIALRAAGASSLMDNTDGMGQTLYELAAASGVAFVLEEPRVRLHPLVTKVARALDANPLDFALGAGADFALVGTVPPLAMASLPEDVACIGKVEAGQGVWIERGGSRTQIEPNGWNYFTAHAAEPLEAARG